MSVVSLGKTDNGKLIEIKQGQTLSIRLPENPTTGYRWEMDSTPISGKTANLRIIFFENSSYMSGTDTGIGGGGERVFVYKAASIGTTQLQLKLWRPWEGERSVIERYSLTIKVFG